MAIIEVFDTAKGELNLLIVRMLESRSQVNGISEKGYRAEEISMDTKIANRKQEDKTCMKRKVCAVWVPLEVMWQNTCKGMLHVFMTWRSWSE